MKQICTRFLLFSAIAISLYSCAGLYPGMGGQRGGRGGGGGGNKTGTQASGPMVFDNKGAIPSSFTGKLIKNVQYGSNTNYLGQKEDLKMDILVPPGQSANKKYPLFVFIHGGGFLVGGKSGAGGFRASLAERGFVVASIDYRLGWSREGNRKGCAGDSLDLKYAIYRALQDLNASLRFLVANADQYQIDPNWIFVGGQSAGGVSALNAAFLTQEEAEKDVPGITQKLGPLHGVGNNINTSFKIKGVAAMWGDMHSPDQIDRGEAVPVIFFHGSEDRVAPAREGPRIHVS